MRRIEYPACVRGLSLIRVLFAVLAVQLAIGLQADVAYATPQGMPATMQVSVDHDACPMHSASATDALHAHTPQNNSSGKHDCCKSSCQCQCGSVPLAFNLPITRGIPVTAYIPLVHVSHVANGPADTHFRPPIA